MRSTARAAALALRLAGATVCVAARLLLVAGAEPELAAGVDRQEVRGVSLAAAPQRPTAVLPHEHAQHSLSLTITSTMHAIA